MSQIDDAATSVICDNAAKTSMAVAKEKTLAIALAMARNKNNTLISSGLN